MFLIIRLFFIMIGVFFFVTIVAALSIVLRVRRNLQNPFLREGNNQPVPPPGNGEIIEGEFQVLEEKQK